jgi:hypothetical protein
MRIVLFSMTLVWGTSQFCCAQVPGAADSLQAQAARMQNALCTGDYTTFVRYLHPKQRELFGGPIGFALIIDTYEKKGMKLESATVDHAGTFFTRAGKLQSAVQQHTKIKMRQGYFVGTSTLIGFSSDNGAHWIFTDANNKTNEEIHQFLPTLSPKIVIPPQVPPVHYQ